MEFISILRFLFLVILNLKLIQSKVTYSIFVYNYQNYKNLKHDGSKCEVFHWMDDHCDPMFEICVYGRKRCDIVYKQTNFWANTRFVGNVFSQIVARSVFQKNIHISIKVEDHDRFDAHDHIAMFTKSLYGIKINRAYTEDLDVYPRNINVQLRVKIIAKCSTDYYGEACETICQPLPGYYSCSRLTGEKICEMDCGYHGKCVRNRHGFYCECNPGWTGNRCQRISLVDYNIYNNRPYNNRYNVPSIIQSLRSKFVTKKLYIKSTVPLYNTIINSTTRIPKILKIYTAFTKVPTYKRPNYFNSTTSTVSKLLNVSSSSNFFSTKKYSETRTKSDPVATSTLHQMTAKTSFSTLSKESNYSVKYQEIKAISGKMKSNENEENFSWSGKINFFTIILSVVIVALAMIIAYLAIQYVKLKYKLKYMTRSYATRPLPLLHPVNNRDRICKQKMTRLYLPNPEESEYDFCTIQTSLKDEQNEEDGYEEPISKFSKSHS